MGRERSVVSGWSDNVYDQASRFILRMDEVALLLWLAGASAEEVAFKGWLDTRTVPWPGHPDRTCDTLAAAFDLLDGRRPWALLFDSQAEPDPDMFGRVLQYLGAVFAGLRPSPLPGDRYFVGAVILNLTGEGQTGQVMRLGRTGVFTHLGVIEWNLAQLKAGDILDEVAAGRAPRLLLVWLPLMQNGGDSDMIERWLLLAGPETDKKLRGALAQAQVFAEKAGCGPAWRKALKGWNVMESEIVKEWTAQARAESKAEALVVVLEGRFKKVPDELRSAILAVADTERLTGWIRVASKARSLRQFRTEAGL